MINKEDIEKLKKHCEKQIQLSAIFNDLKTAREHETILALIKENEKVKEFYKLRDRWYMFRTHIKKCLDDLEVARYDISADEYIDKKHILEGVLAKMDELEKLYD